MRTSSWIAAIGLALITFIILIAAGVITFKTEPVEDTTSNSNKASIIKVVNEDELPVYKVVEDLVINERA